MALGCRHRSGPAQLPPAAPVVAKPARPPIPARAPLPALAAGETYAYDRGAARKLTVEAARAAGLLDVDLGDGWAPYILQDGGGDGGDAAKPNDYRETFVALANDKLSAEEKQSSSAGDQNFLEVFGIPPTLSVLAARVEAEVAPAREACYDAVDREGLEQFTGDVGFLDRDRSKRDYEQALHDADWIAKETTARSADAATGVSLAPEAVLAQLREDPKARGRVDRYLRGKTRVRAVRAAQARLLCEGLLSPKSRYTPGSYDLPTHEALATWERKHDIFGWGFLGGETLGMLLAPNRSLLLDDLRRVLAERVADAAGIVEDGSINQARKRNPPTWRDAAGASHPVPDLIDDHVNALLTAIGVQTPEQAVAFLRAHKAGLAGLHVAFKAAAAAGVLRRRQEHGPQRRDRSRRHLVRPAVRRARQAGRAAARSLPAPDALRALERPEDPALLVAHDDRLVAQRDARGRARVLQVQELRHRSRASGSRSSPRRSGSRPTGRRPRIC